MQKVGASKLSDCGLGGLLYKPDMYACMYVYIYIYVYVRYDVLEYSNSTLKSRGTAAAACYGTQSS